MLSVILVTSSIYLHNSISFDAYGNGLTQANMIRSEDKNNQASLFIGISPLLLKNDTIDNFIIKFELYNIENKSRYANAAYQIAMVKNDYSSHSKDRSVFNGTFLTRNGFLTLNINTSDKNNQSGISGKQTGIIFYTDTYDNVNLTIPYHLQSGQYHVRSLVTLPNHQQLSFDTICNVGEIKSKVFTFNRNMSNVTVISYHDRINDFSFDRNNRTFTWQVPFEYNLSRIDEGKVKVHEEIIIPNYFLESLNATGFNMTMNGHHFDESLFVVDPYTIQDKTIIHYVPKDNALFEISNNSGSQRSNWLMKFVLYLR
ncbi:MAG: hypothetical protein WBQ16_00465 [Nitrososphaeraceae archaeon]